MPHRLLDGHTVDERTARRHTNRYGRIADGLFPPPIKLGRLSRWVESEIDAIIAEIRGDTPDQIRHLVRENDTVAGYQASEGAIKAEGGFDADLASVYINTFAHFIVVSKQVLSDEKQLQQTLGDLFRYRVLEFFERLVVIGTGVGRNVLGLATAATASGATGDNAADRIGATGSLLDDMGWQADLVILNPNDWHAIRSERADTGNGQCLSGGWSQPAQPSIWSMPVVTTSSLAVGTAIVMDTAAALVLDREAPTVLISSEDRDNFVKNMVTILAEMRGGLAILNPSAILSVDLTP